MKGRYQLALLSLLTVATAALTAPLGDAPKRENTLGTWANGVKNGFGTSFESYDPGLDYSARSATAPLSRVWFTLSEGSLTEILWPSVDRAQTRATELIITDGKRFIARDSRPGASRVEWIRPGVPVFVSTLDDSHARFVLEKRVYTHPRRDVVLIDVRFVPRVPGLRLYVHHDPQVGMTPMSNSARVSTGAAPGSGLFAWQNIEAQALVASLPFTEATAGFVGDNAGLEDLAADGDLDLQYERALSGNVATTGRLGIADAPSETRFVIAIGFGRDIESAYAEAVAAVKEAENALAEYIAQWEGYQKTIAPLPEGLAGETSLYRASVALLKASEDKTRSGAFIQSPAVPWGQYRWDRNEIGTAKLSQLVAGDRIVSPASVYQAAIALLSAGDEASPLAAMEHLRRIQFPPEAEEWEFGTRRFPRPGSFAESSWTDGTPYADNLNTSHAALAVMLAYRLWKEELLHPADCWGVVKAAADFLVGVGPWSQRERWGEHFGISPETVALQITGLWLASELAEHTADWGRAQTYRVAADQWTSKPGENVDTWTFTSEGARGNGCYYLRIEAARDLTQIWNPDDHTLFRIAHQGKWIAERDMIGSEFLELVRQGLRSATSAHVLETLPEWDAANAKEVDGAWFFYRYPGDRYSYDDQTGLQIGRMLWPMLTLERGFYELARAIGEDRGGGDLRRMFLDPIRSVAGDTLMIPQQVGDFGAKLLRPTGAATPHLAAHAEYLKLVRSLRDNAVYDTLATVRRRAKRFATYTGLGLLPSRCR